MMVATAHGGRLQHPVVVVHTRVGCGLCRTAEALVAVEVNPDHVEVIDIDTNEELLRRYHIRVPVIEVDGEVVAEGQVHPGEVRAAVRSARWRRMRHGGPHQ